MRATYIEVFPVTYLDYFDLNSGVLSAEPGHTYEIAVASGRHPDLPLPPGDGRWIVVEEPKKKAAAEAGRLTVTKEN